jgi:thioredoxin-like negative regulator of GroEL
MTILEINSQEEFEQALDNNTGSLVALFTAPAWCPPCRKFEPQYEEAQNYTDATLLTIDVDKNPWTADEGIRAVPTIKLYKGNDYVRNLKAANAVAFAQSITE